MEICTPLSALTPSPWTYMEGGDGWPDDDRGYGPIAPLLQPANRYSVWLSGIGAHFNDNGQVTSNGLTDIPLNPIGAIVNAPLKRNAANQLMLAVAAGDSTGYGVYGIFADSQGLGMHYELLGRIPIGLGLGPVTALGSSDGSVVFVGMSGGLIYAINTGQQNHIEVADRSVAELIRRRCRSLHKPYSGRVE